MRIKQRQIKLVYGLADIWNNYFQQTYIINYTLKVYTLNPNSKYYKKSEDDRVEFFDSETDTKTMEWLYEDGEIFQIRIFLNDPDKTVKNKMLIFNKRPFIRRVVNSHERHFQRDGKDVVEYYSEDELWMYSETERKGQLEICKCYGDDGEMFSREIIEYDKDGNEISEESLVYNADGTKTEHKIDLTKMDRETFFNM